MLMSPLLKPHLLPVSIAIINHLVPGLHTLSISTMTTFSTLLWRSTSRAVAPSPPAASETQAVSLALRPSRYYYAARLPSQDSAAMPHVLCVSQCSCCKCSYCTCHCHAECGTCVSHHVCSRTADTVTS
ncbi:hypothetical protein COO60DRAFT_654038 [Scenedesmus sp. NREL 46B-D3]|nr:hypothetical protein COO60DRAFT_654038 [Scenedesmus sp. NREL 46B-D3]